RPCTVTVSYSPSAAGASDSGTLTATSQKPKASATLTLTGAAPLCRVVDTTTSQSYATLQAAVNAAAAGDTLVVKGTCTGSTTIDRNLTISGQGYGGNTRATLDGGRNGSVLAVTSGVTVTLNTLIITGGSSWVGGGIYNYYGTVTLNDSSVSDNAARAD